jgi:hypothetical protein
MEAETDLQRGGPSYTSKPFGNGKRDDSRDLTHDGEEGRDEGDGNPELSRERGKANGDGLRNQTGWVVETEIVSVNHSTRPEQLDDETKTNLS